MRMLVLAALIPLAAAAQPQKATLPPLVTLTEMSGPGPARDFLLACQRAALRAGFGQIAGVIVGDGEVGRSHELSVATQVDGADVDGNTWWAAYR